MAQKRDNCIILLVDPPEAEKINQDLKTAFGPERAAHVNSDLLSAAYRLAKGYSEAILILSYEKTSRHPDLTWLDQEDPGFLEVKNRSGEDRLQDAFRLSFFTGARKALFINHLSPDMKTEWFTQALEALNDKTIAIGANQDGSIYLLGLTQQNLKLLENPGFSGAKSAETLCERAKKNKLAVFNTPETYAITSEESLLAWMETKETLPEIFQAPQQQQPHETKKHHKRHGKNNQELQVEPPLEKPPL